MAQSSFSIQRQRQQQIRQRPPPSPSNRSSSQNTSLSTVVLRSTVVLLFWIMLFNVLLPAYQLPSPDDMLTDISINIEVNSFINADMESLAQSKRQTLLRETDNAIAQSSSWWTKTRQLVKTDKDGHILNGNISALAEGETDGGEPDGFIDQGQDSAHSLEEVKRGREELLALLEDAGVTNLDGASIEKLPKWESVRKLYYDNIENPHHQDGGPVIYGLGTCAQFRDTIPADSASIGVAGLFNTGTNPAAMYLAANCKMPDSREKNKGMRWQVPWGKHMVANRKWNNTAKHDHKVNKTTVLPVVMIRDPYSWMQSMCKHPYGAGWPHAAKLHHCPNLVPTDADKSHHSELRNLSHVPVHIGYPGETAYWPSLAHLWTDWYQQYLKADYPRLIVRFEDIIFRQKELMRQICTCAGAVPTEDAFSYVVGAGKWGASHKGSSNLISAIVKYGSDQHRFDGMTKLDLKYASQYLDPDLMRFFQYRQPIL